MADMIWGNKFTPAITPYKLCISLLICYFVRKQSPHKSKLGSFLIRQLEGTKQKEPEKSWEELSSVIQSQLESESTEVLTWLTKKVRKSCTNIQTLYSTIY